YRGNQMIARDAICADQSFLEIRAVPRETSRYRYALADDACDARHEFAAIDAQPIRQNEYAGQIGRGQSLANRCTAFARLLRRVCWFARETNGGGFEAQRAGGNFVVADVVVVDLSARAASDDMRVRKQLSQLIVARGVRERLPRAEIQDELGLVHAAMAIAHGARAMSRPALCLG